MGFGGDDAGGADGLVTFLGQGGSLVLFVAEVALWVAASKARKRPQKANAPIKSGRIFLREIV